jgi:hypothetical protein
MSRREDAPMVDADMALLDAWDRWDARPSQRESAARYQAALAPVAAHLGLRGTGELRDRLNARRRAGATRPQALAAVRAELGIAGRLLLRDPDADALSLLLEASPGSEVT